jgi:hypothetical protein
VIGNRKPVDGLMGEWERRGGREKFSSLVVEKNRKLNADG